MDFIANLTGYGATNEEKHEGAGQASGSQPMSLSASGSEASKAYAAHEAAFSKKDMTPEDGVDEVVFSQGDHLHGGDSAETLGSARYGTLVTAKSSASSTCCHKPKHDGNDMGDNNGHDNNGDNKAKNDTRAHVAPSAESGVKVYAVATEDDDDVSYNISMLAVDKNPAHRANGMNSSILDVTHLKAVDGRLPSHHSMPQKNVMTESDLKYGFLDEISGCTIDEFKSFDVGKSAGARRRLKGDERAAGEKDEDVSIVSDAANVMATGSFWKALLYPFNGEGHNKRSEIEKVRHLQLLPTWMPVYHWKYVAGCAFLTILVFFSSGIALFSGNNNAVQIELDYTYCRYLASEDMSPFPKEEYEDVTRSQEHETSNFFGYGIGQILKNIRPSEANRWIREWKYDSERQECTMRFEIPVELGPHVFMYVGLSEVYQNHRLYLYSRDAAQLRGDHIPDAGKLNKYTGFMQYANCDEAAKHRWLGGKSQALANVDCIKPLEERDQVILDAAPNAQYYPAGLIANSMFTDSFSPLKCVDIKEYEEEYGADLSLYDEMELQCNDSSYYEFTEKGIAWDDDANEYSDGNVVDTKDWAKNLTDEEIRTTLIPPPQWRDEAFMDGKYVDGYDRSNLPDLRSWERFRVWSRPAGLPKFRKIWGRNDDNLLKIGVYEITVKDVYEVVQFAGTKSVVFATMGPTGSRGSYAGIAFLMVGVAGAVVLALATFVHPRKKGELSKLSWNRNGGNGEVKDKYKTDSWLYNGYSGDEDVLYPVDESDDILPEDVTRASRHNHNHNHNHHHGDHEHTHN